MLLSSILRKMRGSSVNCTFSNNICGYTITNTSTLFTFSYTFDAGKLPPGAAPPDAVVYSGASGTITSPNYPYEYYNNLYITYIILGKPKSTITIYFQAFDLEVPYYGANAPYGNNCPYDYLLLMVGSNEYWRQCGAILPRTQSVRGVEFITLIFRSDGSVTRSGFMLTYKIEANTDLNLEIGLNMGSDNTTLSYLRKISIKSPPFSYNTTSCLELKYTALAGFVVKLARPMASSGTYTELILHRNLMALGNVEQLLRLPLPAITSDYESYSLAFEAKTVKAGKLVIINSVLVYSGECPRPDDSRVNCSFEDGETCGYSLKVDDGSNWSLLSSSDVSSRVSRGGALCEFDGIDTICTMVSPVIDLSLEWNCLRLESTLTDDVILKAWLQADDKVLASVDLSGTIDYLENPGLNSSTALRIRASRYGVATQSEQAAVVHKAIFADCPRESDVKLQCDLSDVSFCGFSHSNYWSIYSWHPPHYDLFAMGYIGYDYLNANASKLLLSPGLTLATPKLLALSLLFDQSLNSTVGADVILAVFQATASGQPFRRWATFDYTSGTTTDDYHIELDGSVCLPAGSYRLAFEVQIDANSSLAPSSYRPVVSITNITLTNDDCKPMFSPPDGNDTCNGAVVSLSMSSEWDQVGGTDCGASLVAAGNYTGLKGDLQYDGQWLSKLLSVSNDSALCITLNLTVPPVFQISADFLTSNNSYSVFKLVNEAGASSGRDRVAMFEVEVQQNYYLLPDTVQIAVSVTAGVTLRNVAIANGQCKPGGHLDSTLACDFEFFNNCGFMDKSADVSRWAIASRDYTDIDIPINGSEFTPECLMTQQGENYLGTLNVTEQDHPCVTWSNVISDITALPDYARNQSVTWDDVNNYCRNAYPTQNRPYCYAMDRSGYGQIGIELCAIPKCKVYYAKVGFGTDASIAILESPVVNLTSGKCLSFSYMITSVTIELRVLAATSTNAKFAVLETVSYTSQRNASLWSTTSVLLTADVTRIRFHAVKTSPTIDSHSVFVDKVKLQDCSFPDTSNLETPVSYTGPRLPMDAYRQLVLRETEDLDMQNITAMLGRQRVDLVFKCTWNGMDCEREMIVSKQTNMGQCFTFNHNVSSPLHSDKTGPDYGLQLTLNLERYENLPYSSSDFGIKVYLHSQQDIPLVAELGSSVEPGKHGSMSIGYTETTNLKPPYGTCGHQQLQFYNDSNVYSKARCMMECKVQSLLDRCGCKDYYMPGSMRICNLTEYINCVELWKAQINRTDVRECDCKNDCQVTSFSSEISSSQLSPQSLLLDSEISARNLSSRSLRAMDTMNRVDSQTMLATTTALNAVIASYEALRNLINLEIIDTGTALSAIISRLLTAADKLTHKTVDDSVAFLKWLRKEYSRIDYFVKSLSGRLQTANEMLAEVELMLIDNADINKYYTHVPAASQTQVLDLLDIFTAINTDLQNLDGQVLKQVGFLTGGRRAGVPLYLVVSESCAVAKKSLIASLNNTSTWLNSDGDFVLMSTAHDKADDTREQLAKVSECLLEYGNGLDEFLRQLSSLRFGNADVIDTSSATTG